MYSRSFKIPIYFYILPLVNLSFTQMDIIIFHGFNVAAHSTHNAVIEMPLIKKWNQSKWFIIPLTN